MKTILRFSLLGSSVVLLVVLLATNFKPSFAQSTNELSTLESFYHVEETKEPETLDDSWIIQKIEKKSFIDETTGEVVEQILTYYRSEKDEAHEHNCELLDEDMTSNCNFEANLMLQSEITKEGVTSWVRHYAKQYCRNAYDCENYKPTRVEVWWTRSNTSRTIKNTSIENGCSTCNTCDSSLYTAGTGIIAFNPPAWISAYQTSTTNFFIIYPFEIARPNGSWGGQWYAKVRSDVYEGSTFKAHIFNNPSY